MLCRNVGHELAHRFLWRRISDAESDRRANSNGDSHSARISGGRRDDRTRQQENRQTGACRVQECGYSLERGCERICRCRAGFEAGGECGQSDRRIRSFKRRRKPGEQSGDDGGWRSRGSHGKSRDAGIKSVAGDVRPERLDGCTNDSDCRHARARIIRTVRRFQFCESGETDSGRRQDAAPDRSQESFG